MRRKLGLVYLVYPQNRWYLAVARNQYFRGRLMGRRQFLLRGHEGVQTEWLWGTTAFNLKKLTALVGALRAESATRPEAAID